MQNKILFLKFFKNTTIQMGTGACSCIKCSKHIYKTSSKVNFERKNHVVIKNNICLMLLFHENEILN